MALPEYHDNATTWRDLADKLTGDDIAELERLEQAGQLDVEDLLDLARYRVTVNSPSPARSEPTDGEMQRVCGIPRWMYLAERNDAVQAFLDRPPTPPPTCEGFGMGIVLPVDLT